MFNTDPEMNPNQDQLNELTARRDYAEMELAERHNVALYCGLHQDLREEIEMIETQIKVLNERIWRLSNGSGISELQDGPCFYCDEPREHLSLELIEG